MPKSIDIYHDWDGVHVFGPPPKEPSIKLLLGKPFSAEFKPLETYQPPKGPLGALKKVADILAHKYRPATPDSLKSVAQIAEALEQYGREGRQLPFSGREQHLHPLTEEMLTRRGYMRFFDELRLNPGHGSTAWKVGNVMDSAQDQRNVVVFENDIQTAISIAGTKKELRRKKLNSTVVIYLINFGPERMLFEWAKPELDQSIIPFDNLHDAVRDFRSKLREGEI